MRAPLKARSVLIPLLLAAAPVRGFAGGGSLSGLSGLAAGGEGALGAAYDGSAGGGGTARGRSFSRAGAGSGFEGLSRFRGYAAPGRGGRTDVPAPVSSRFKGARLPGVLKKAYRFSVGACLGAILFGGIVGALAGVTLLSCASAAWGLLKGFFKKR